MADETVVPPAPCDAFGVFFGRIVIEHDVDLLFGGDFVREGVEKADELTIGVTLHGTPDDTAFEHVRHCISGGDAVPLGVVVPHRPFISGNPGWVRSCAWIKLFSSTDSTVACSGTVDVKSDDVLDLGGKLGGVGQPELPKLMRLPAVAAPTAMHQPDAGRAGSSHGGRKSDP